GTYVDLSSYGSYSELKVAVLTWIMDNPKKASDYAVRMSGAGTVKGAGMSPEIKVTENGVESTGVEIRSDGTVGRTKYKYYITDGFMSKIKALTAAASNPDSSPEEMIRAGRMMYDAGSSKTGKSSSISSPRDSGFFSSGGSSDAVDLSGTSYGRARSSYSGTYDDFKLNRAALEQETSRAERIISAFRGDGSGPKGAEQYFAHAWKAYGNFEGFVSPLKSRKVITSSESEKLEHLRADLRKSLAGLSLRLMSLYAEEMSRSIKDGDEGHAAMIKSLRRLISNLDSRLEEAGSTDDLQKISGILSLAGAEFSAFYMSYSVYSRASDLKKQAENLSFSCLYDKIMFAVLSRIAPGSPYVAARKNLKQSASKMTPVIEQSAAGNIDAAFSGGNMDVLNQALFAALDYSLSNRKAQYFSWGMIFRPFELNVIMRNGKPVFLPSFPWMVYKAEKQIKRLSEPSPSASPDGGRPS
ncbi:MAG: hypothetical protein J5706_07980, partial [Elusimicrobiales bacterium]|nr:hypothetical protein [Elusimicrobiales bacterium]